MFPNEDRQKTCPECGSWDNCEFCDEAYQSDMRALRRSNLKNDVEDSDYVPE